MRFLTSIFLSASLIWSCHAYVPASTIETDVLAATGLSNLISFVQNHTSRNNCTLENAAVRLEWGSLAVEERKAYTDAVLCLMERPSVSDPLMFPGARSRYDDFLVVHINQTTWIHETANFLTWHRYYVWAYEKALRDECGYKGYQPYWNWGKYAFDPIGSPLFDGSEYSLSGNGVYQQHNCTEVFGLLNCIPPGTGGGCINSGPFANVTVNLGPISPTLKIPETESLAPNYAYNPRCMRRDISSWVSSNWTKDSDSARLIKNNFNIAAFQSAMQGIGLGDYGVHGGGHFTFGGDPSGDIYTSPGDPAFWLHHANIDRTYWIWQNHGLDTRLDTIAGTITMANNPPSRNGTLEDWVELGINAEPKQIKELMSTTEGPFCYIYR